MNVTDTVEKLLIETGVTFVKRVASSGFVYFVISSDVLTQIRIANHSGHIQPAKSVEYRTDACTKKSGTRHVIGKGDEFKMYSMIRNKLTKELNK